MAVVVTVFSVILTSAHVVVALRVLIVETGTSPMELDCHLLEMAVSFKNRWHKRVDLRHRSHVTSATGIYRCDVPTNTVSSYADTSVRDTVYVGLYTTGGKCYVELMMAKEYESNKPY